MREGVRTALFWVHIVVLGTIVVLVTAGIAQAVAYAEISWKEGWPIYMGCILGMFFLQFMDWIFKKFKERRTQ